MSRISYAGARNACVAYVFVGFVAMSLLGCARAPSSSTEAMGTPFVQWRSQPLTSAPRRCVPANAGLVDMLAALIDPGRLAAIPAQADSWSVLAAPTPLASRCRRIPRFDRYVAERVLAHRPDLVLVDPFNAPETTNRLVEAGVAVLQVASSPHWEQVLGVLGELGSILGEPQRARSLVRSLEARRQVLRDKTEGREPVRALAYSNQGAGGFGAANDTTMDEVLRLAGCVNVLGGRAGWAPLSFEDLLALDPDVLVLSGAPGERAVAETVLREAPVLRSLGALERDRIVKLPPRLFSATSQEMLTAAEVLSDAVDVVLQRASKGRER